MLQKVPSKRDRGVKNLEHYADFRSEETFQKNAPPKKTIPKICFSKNYCVPRKKLGCNCSQLKGSGTAGLPGNQEEEQEEEL